MPLDPDPVKDILYKTTARFLQVHAHGIILQGGLPRTSCRARILAVGAARTLYRGRRPHCRSLDSIHSIEGTCCLDCHDIEHCTSQLRIHLLIEHQPYKVLLAYTSAKNFLIYRDSLAKRHLDLDQVTTAISVVDRATWGELRFKLAVE